MEFLRYAFEVCAVTTMTAAEIEHLIFQARRHYDLRCSAAGRQGGFLYGWSNGIDMDRPSVFVVTTSQADTICKILEIPDSSDELRSAFASLLRNMMRKYDQINKCKRSIGRRITMANKTGGDHAPGT